MEILAGQERCDCWNIPGEDGNTPIMYAVKTDKIKITAVLLRCPRVDLNCRDKEGWSLVFRAIERKEFGEKMSKCLVKQIL